MQIFLAFILGSVGILVALIGWRGRRIDDHPVCRRCGFDLFGLPKTSVVCSECGSSLAGKGAIRNGARKRLHPLLVSGFVLASIAPFVARLDYQRINFAHYKPFFWLLKDARRNDPTGFAAINELEKRQSAGTLNRSQTRALAQTALEMGAAQHETHRDDPWGAFIEIAHDAGLLDKDLWEQYALQNISIECDVPQKWQRGSIVRLSTSAYIIWREGRIDSAIEYKPKEQFLIDGQPVPPDLIDRYRGKPVGLAPPVNQWQHFEHMIALDQPYANALSEGRHSLKIILNGQILRNRGYSSEVMTQYTTEFEKSFTVLPHPHWHATLVEPEDPLGPRNYLRHPNARITIFSDGEIELTASFRFARRVVFDVFAPALHRDAPIGYLVGTNDQWPSSDLDLKHLEEKKLDIVLRPDLFLAEQIYGATEIYGEELTIRDVPVKKQNTQGNESENN